MPATAAAVLNRKRTLTGSEIHAYSRNRFEDRTLRSRVQNISQRAQVSHDRHQREIIQWRSFRRESKKHSGVWDQSFDSDNSVWPTTPRQQVTQRTEFADLDLDVLREPKLPQAPPQIPTPRTRSASVELARSLSYQSEAVSRLQKPWAYAYTCESYNSVYSEAVQIAKGQEKRLFLRRASSALPTRPNTGQGLASASIVTDNGGISSKFERNQNSPGYASRRGSEWSAGRPQTGRSTPGISLRVSDNTERNVVKTVRPKTSSGLIRGTDDTCDGLAAAHTNTSVSVPVVLLGMDPGLDSTLEACYATTSVEDRQPHMRKVSSLPVLQSQLSSMSPSVEKGHSCHRHLSLALPTHAEEGSLDTGRNNVTPQHDTGRNNVTPQHDTGRNNVTPQHDTGRNNVTPQHDTGRNNVTPQHDTGRNNVTPQHDTGRNNVTPQHDTGRNNVTPQHDNVDQGTVVGFSIGEELVSERVHDPFSPAPALYEAPVSSDIVILSGNVEKPADASESTKALPAKQLVKRVSISEVGTKVAKKTKASALRTKSVLTQPTNTDGAVANKMTRRDSQRNGQDKTVLSPGDVIGKQLKRSASAVNVRVTDKSKPADENLGTDKKRSERIWRNNSAQFLTGPASPRRGEMLSVEAVVFNLQSSSDTNTAVVENAGLQMKENRNTDYCEQTDKVSDGADCRNTRSKSARFRSDNSPNQGPVTPSQVRGQGKNISHETKMKGISCPPLAGGGQEREDGLHAGNNNHGKSDSHPLSTDKLLKGNQRERNTAATLSVHITTDKMIVNCDDARSLSATPSPENPKADVISNRPKTAKRSDQDNGSSAPDTENRSRSGRDKGDSRRPSSIPAVLRQFSSQATRPQRAKSRAENRTRKEADASENEAAEGQDKTVKETQASERLQPSSESASVPPRPAVTSEDKERPGSAGRTDRKNDGQIPEFPPQRPHTSVAAPDPLRTTDNCDYDDNISCFSGDSDYTVFRGFPIRNYVRPQHRYKVDPFLTSRRERLMLRLSMENPVFLNGSRNEHKAEVVFPKKARRKVLQELVEKNSAPVRKEDKGVVPPELRAKIDEFFKTLEPLCPKPNFSAE